MSTHRHSTKRVELPLRHSPEDLGARRVVHRLLRDGWRVYAAHHEHPSGYDEDGNELRPIRLWLYRNLGYDMGGLGVSYVKLRVHNEQHVSGESTPHFGYQMRAEYQMHSTHFHRYVVLRTPGDRAGGWADLEDFVRMCRAIHRIPCYFGSDGGLGKVIELGQERVVVQRENFEAQRERPQVEAATRR